VREREREGMRPSICFGCYNSATVFTGPCLRWRHQWRTMGMDDEMRRHLDRKKKPSNYRRAKGRRKKNKRRTVARGWLALGRVVGEG